MSFKSAIPIRVFQVFAGAGADDDSKMLLVTCRSDGAAATAVRALEQLKRDGALVIADGVQFFQVVADIETILNVVDVNDAIAQGYLVRSVVVAAADVPKSGVLAVLAGAKADPGQKAAGDVVDSQKAG